MQTKQNNKEFLLAVRIWIIYMLSIVLSLLFLVTTETKPLECTNSVHENIARLQFEEQAWAENAFHIANHPQPRSYVANHAFVLQAKELKKEKKALKRLAPACFAENYQESLASQLVLIATDRKRNRTLLNQYTWQDQKEYSETRNTIKYLLQYSTDFWGIASSYILLIFTFLCIMAILPLPIVDTEFMMRKIRRYLDIIHNRHLADPFILPTGSEQERLNRIRQRLLVATFVFGVAVSLSLNYVLSNAIYYFAI